ncbi:MAG: hypothetical protein WCH34_08765 [Bacteroidota bacterium]
MGTTNIPVKTIPAIIYIEGVDDLQLSQGSGGVGTHRWQDWHWELEESEYWTSARQILVPFLESYSNKKTITTDQRKLVNDTIKSLRDYSSYNVNGHRLLLKIAAFGNNHEWMVANIKFGTPLAKKPSKGASDSPEFKQPVITVLKNMLGEMELRVVSGENQKSTKLPAGMKFAKVYRYIGITPPKSIADFSLYGNAKRGKIAINFDGIDLSGNSKIYAYFYGVYESNKGKLGQPGPIVSALILHQ